MLAKKHSTLMMSRFFVIGGIEPIVKCQKVEFSRAKVQKIGVEMGRKSHDIRFFHELLHFFGEKLCCSDKFI